jgi:hypothetical protein
MSVPSVADTATTPSAADAKSDINGQFIFFPSQILMVSLYSFPPIVVNKNEAV